MACPYRLRASINSKGTIMHGEQILIALASIVLLGIGAQWLGWRLKLPSILLLLLFGFLAGPILGIVDPDALLGETLFPLVSLAVGLILFEGGLNLKRSELVGIRSTVYLLISVGVLLTWAIGTAGAYFLLDFDITLATLLGAILVVSGPTVVIPLLNHVRPSERVTSVLKWEGILVDPVGATLAVLVFQAILGGSFESFTLTGAVTGTLLTLLIGGVLGGAGALLLLWLFSGHRVPEHLQTPVTLMLVVAVFVLANLLRAESGLMATTLMGIILANQQRVNVKHVVTFNEELGILILSALFILLAARLNLADLLAVGWRGLVFLALLVLVARPLAVLLSTIRSELPNKERLFLAWLAPRGIVAVSVASLFAFDLAEAGYAEAEALVPVTFLVVIGTVALYGLTAGPLAQRLGLSRAEALDAPAAEPKIELSTPIEYSAN